MNSESTCVISDGIPRHGIGSAAESGGYGQLQARMEEDVKVKKVLTAVMAILVLVGSFSAGNALTETQWLYEYVRLNCAPYASEPVKVTAKYITNRERQPDDLLINYVRCTPMNRETGLFLINAEIDMDELDEYVTWLDCSDDGTVITVRLNKPGLYSFGNTHFIFFDPADPEQMAIKAELEDAVSRCMAGTEKETAKKINDWICKRIDYDYASASGTEESWGADCLAYNALKRGLATCGGYSDLYCMMLGMAGIECYGMGGDTKKGGHTWNLCRLDGEWSYTDVTWNDTSSQKYFAKSREEMEKDHLLDKNAQNFLADYIEMTPYDIMIRAFDAEYGLRTVLPQALKTMPAGAKDYKAPNPVYVKMKSLDFQGSSVRFEFEKSGYILSQVIRPETGYTSSVSPVRGTMDHIYNYNTETSKFILSVDYSNYSLLEGAPEGREVVVQHYDIFRGHIVDQWMTQFVPLKKGEYPGYRTGASGRTYKFDGDKNLVSAGVRLARDDEVTTVTVHFTPEKNVSGYSVRYEQNAAGYSFGWDCLRDGTITGISETENGESMVLEDITELTALEYHEGIRQAIEEKYGQSAFPERARIYRIRRVNKVTTTQSEYIVTADPLFLWEEDGAVLNANAMDVAGNRIDLTPYKLNTQMCEKILIVE